MKAIIMAGGEGSRLRPLTCCRPKPMVKVIDKPVMAYTIELLKRYDITEIGVTLRYMPQEIMRYFGDGSRFGVQLTYFVEDTPLGTAGSVRNTGDFLDDTFLVISGDAITDINLRQAVEYHESKGADATLILSQVDIPLEYGVVVTDTNGTVERFVEKPGWGEVISDAVNTGIYILEPSVLTYLEEGKNYDFASDLFPALLHEKKRLYGYIAEGYWCDIGDIFAYMSCQYDILDKKVDLKLEAQEVAAGIWIGENVHLAEQVKLDAPVYIASGASIDQGADIQRYSIIGTNAHIGTQASVKRSIVSRGCSVGARAQLRGCILCDKSSVKASASVYEQAVVGDMCLLGERVSVMPSIKLWPKKIVDNDIQVRSNMVWEDRHKRHVFSGGVLIGELGIDVTPEYVSELGACFGASLSGGRIAISRNGNDCSHMLQNALMAGLMSAGSEVYDCGIQTLPATRAAVRFYNLNGAIHITVRQDSSGYMVKARFLDDTGCDINRSMLRKIENLYEREDFVRASGNEIKALVNVENYKDFYLRDLVERSGFRTMNGKVLIHTASALAQSAFRNLAQESGSELIVSERTIHKKNKEEVLQFCETVREGGYLFGALIDDECEKVLFVDDLGQTVDSDHSLLLHAALTLTDRRGATVIVPTSAPARVDALAAEYGGYVSRTKTSEAEYMRAMAESGNTQQLLFQFDGLGAVLRLAAFLTQKKCKLSSIMQEFGELYMKRSDVICQQEQKGRVIREILKEISGNAVDTTDGIKITSEKGWVLAVPDSAEPVFRVTAEGASAEFADELASGLIDKINKILSNQEK